MDKQRNEAMNIFGAALSCDDNRRERHKERERERERERCVCDDHSVGFLLLTWCKSKVGTLFYLLASCSIFCCYILIFILSSTTMGHGDCCLLPISGSQ